MLTCAQCSKPMDAPPRGRRPRYCSRSCQARAYRARAAVRKGSPPHSAGNGELPPRTPPARPPEGMSVRQIVRAAVEIADREGLDAVSMRRIATQLGLATMSLYRFVSGKDALIELMVDAVHGENGDDAPVDAGWRTRLEFAARREWGIYSRHPWVLRIVATPQPPVGPNVLAGVERPMRAMDGLGLDAVTMHWVAIAVGAQVQGAALLLVNELETKRRTGRTTQQWRSDKSPAIRELLDSGRFPMLTRLFEEQEDVADINAWFEFSLERLLDGLEVFVDGRAGVGKRSGVAGRAGVEGRARVAGRAGVTGAEATC
ncbi:TetR family transcriptional regulator [Nonomuraea fuscirosea]|uniref:TetR family transcriptional regulator n=2 Tax=Nonomuraea fuscirosea TaxID=1291556 RepID=A0A2T0N5Y3_9ACTN|nr:TetR family transcriptional regulator [Nonomuraea fuscirosea]